MVEIPRHLLTIFFENETIFESAYATAPWTVPSFASIFFGKLPSDVSLNQYSNDKRGSLQGILKENRYTIKAIVPQPRDSHKGRPLGKIILELVSGTFEDSEKPPLYNSDDVLRVASKEIESLLEHEDTPQEPFFMFIHALHVHDPYTPGLPYNLLFESTTEYPEVTHEDIQIAREMDRVADVSHIFSLRYDQEIRKFDDEMREFIENLPQEVIDNTIIILTSDHGEAFGEHGGLLHGRTLYDEELHIPLAIYAPTVGKGRVFKNVSLIDLSPTILDILGIEKPVQLNGESLFSTKRSRVISELGFPSFFQNTSNPPKTIGDVDQNLFSEPIISKVGASLRTEHWKIIKNESGLELYNISKDPGETNNLGKVWELLPRRDRETVEAMLKELETL